MIVVQRSWVAVRKTSQFGWGTVEVVGRDGQGQLELAEQEVDPKERHLGRS